MKMFIGLVLCFVMCCGVMADGLDDVGWLSSERLSGTIIAAPNDGSVFGVAVSYQAFDHLWGDLGLRRYEAATDGFIGLSTDLNALGNVILRIFDIPMQDIPDGWRIGGGYLVPDDSTFFYVGYGGITF